MATAEFPSTIGAPDYPLTETPENAVIRSTMEDGTEKTRPRFTRNRMTFELSWQNMPQDEKEELEAFFRTTIKNGAMAFYWIHPAANKKYYVRFSEIPKFSLKMRSYWQVSIKLKEV